MTPLRAVPVVAVAALLAALLAAGCGSVGRTEAGQIARGKELFNGEGQCAQCHALADAGAQGRVGPDLDASFEQVREHGFEESTIRDVVRGQIAYPVEDPPTGSPGMPANLVTGADADAVASYVAAVAGLPPGSAPGAGEPGGEAPTESTDGAEIFTAAGCGGCHVLAAAGTEGQIGPDLDQARPSAELAIDRVRQGKGAMPAFGDRLSDAQIDAVATYVAENAGR